jgi:hypothetical protein
VTRRVRLLTATLVLVAAASVAAPAGATEPSRAGEIIVLPGASSTEGITAGGDGLFYAGDLFLGDIFRGSIRRGTAERFIDAPDGRMAVGMSADLVHHLLFVAGGATGQGYVYDLTDGTTLATYQFTEAGTAATGFVNDVTVTEGGAWFTNSGRAELYFVSIAGDGTLATEATTLPLTGPAAEPVTEGAGVNGIVAGWRGRTLVVGHTNHQRLYRVDPLTGATTTVEGLPPLPGVDGLELRGHWLWAVQNVENQVSRIRLESDFRSGELRGIIATRKFQTPTTAALVDDRLAVVNAKFDTGVPPTAKQYEVIVVGR